MAKIYGSDRAIIRDALSLLKSFVTKEREDHISKLPRNGKGPSDSSSEAVEKSFDDRLKGIDSVLENLDNSPKENNRIIQKAPLPDRVLMRKEATDEEPYINPFTGLMVHPPSANAPGPSGSRNDSDSSSKDFARSALDRQATTVLQNVTASASNTSSNIPTFSNSATESNISSDFSMFDDVSQLSTISSFMDGFENIYQKQNGKPNASDLVKDDQSLLTPATVVAHKEIKEQAYHIPTLSNDGPVNLTQYKSDSNLDFIQELQIADNGEMDYVVGDQEDASYPCNAETSNLGFMDADIRLAMELAGNTPQTWEDFFVAQDFVTQEQNQLQFEENAIYRRDQEEFIANTAQLKAMEDEWNREWDDSFQKNQAQLKVMEDEWNKEWEESFQKDQAFARHLVEQEEQEQLNEMKRLQELFQTEDEQFEADRILAMSLANEIDEAESPEVADDQPWVANTSNILPPTYSLQPVQSTTEPTPPPGPPPSSFSQPFHQPSSHPEPTISHDRSGWFGRHHTPVDVRNEANNDLTRNFQEALKLHDQMESQRQAEINKNAEAAQSLREEEEKRQAQARNDLANAQRIERQQKEEEQQRKAAEEAKRARMIDCAVCNDSFEKVNIYQFPCKHSYCRECLSQSIQTSISSKKLFQCCKNRVDIVLASRYIGPNLIDPYKGLIQELSTPNPVYCSNRSCSTFIPPADIKASNAICPKCGTHTCANCKSAVHTGICKEDKAGQALLQLGQKKNWKKCLHCGNLVERSSGCLHMTCRCGHDFCYRCGKSWDSCQSTCK